MIRWFSLFILAIASTSYAEVNVITPITPIPLTLPGTSIDIDIDGDSEMDFSLFYDVFQEEPFLHVNIPQSLQSTNKVVVTGSKNMFGKDLVAAVPMGTIISSSSTFNGPVFGNGPLLAQPDFAGDNILEGLGYVYVGVQFDRNGSRHFGWIELSVSQVGDGLQVASYAWEMEGGVPIHMGGTASIEQNPHQGLDIFHIGDGKFKVDSKIEAQLELRVFDILGREVLSTVVDPQSSIDLKGFTRGSYFVSLRADGREVLTRRLIL